MFNPFTIYQRLCILNVIKFPLSYLFCLICLSGINNLAVGQDTIPTPDLNPSVHVLKRFILIDTFDQSCLESICEGQELAINIRPNSFPLRKPQWFQSKLTMLEDYEEVMALKLVGFRGAHEVYWDGELIGTNGVISHNPDSVKFGRYQFYTILPTKLLHKGDHVLSVRYFPIGSTLYNTAYVLFGNYLPMANQDQQADHKMILMLMVFLTSAVFFLIFYAGFGRKMAFLFLSAYCLAYSIKSILKPYQDFYTPDFLIPFMSFKLSHLPANLGSIFLIAFLLWEMSIPKKYWLLLAFTVLSIWGYFGLTEMQYLIVMMTCAGMAVAYGAIQKREGIRWAILGMLGFVTLIISWMYGFFGYGYFSGVIFFLICMTFYVGEKIAIQIRLRQAAQLRSATLENQLLKKSIQPHFILNSLASLQELIDQNPTKASDFVEQLADEFKIVSKVANQRLIPIQDELDMCYTHLKIMEYRKDATFQLITEGLTGREKIPPGIFHTLVENGITHGYGTKRSGLFILTKREQPNQVHYSLFNDGESVPIDNPNQKGTGLRYIEARLKETYGKNWAMEGKALPNGWEVLIKIKT